MSDSIEKMLKEWHKIFSREGPLHPDSIFTSFEICFQQSTVTVLTRINVYTYISTCTRLILFDNKLEGKIAFKRKILIITLWGRELTSTGSKYLKGNI